jgi:hypothetical protein
MRDRVIGPLAIQTLDSIRVDAVFFSAHGLLIPEGFHDPDLNEIEIKRTLIRRASRVIALLDSSKFGKQALGIIAPLSQIDLLITDDEADAHPCKAASGFDSARDLGLCHFAQSRAGRPLGSRRGHPACYKTVRKSYLYKCTVGHRSHGCVVSWLR